MPALPVLRRLAGSGLGPYMSPWRDVGFPAFFRHFMLGDGPEGASQEGQVSRPP